VDKRNEYAVTRWPRRPWSVQSVGFRRRGVRWCTYRRSLAVAGAPLVRQIAALLPDESAGHTVPDARELGPDMRELARTADPEAALRAVSDQAREIDQALGTQAGMPSADDLALSAP
jgi:hypothetical protein